MRSVESCDVVVIGAGAAGLAAAAELFEAGRSVVVLEARDRTGGRVFTLRDPELTTPVELGAEFIHGSDNEILDLARRAGLPVHEVGGEDWVAAEGRLSRDQGGWDPVQRVLSALVHAREPDRSFRHFVDEVLAGRPPREARAATRFVEGFLAADADRASALALIPSAQALQTEGAWRSFRLTGGYDKLLQWLGASLPGESLLLDTRVERIDWRRGKVRVHAKGRFAEPIAVEAAAAIVTVPIGVLRASSGETAAIRFDPPVASLEEALKWLVMGDVVRITFRFASPFWDPVGSALAEPAKPDRDVGQARPINGHTARTLLGLAQPMTELSFLRVPRAALPVWWTMHPADSPLLVGWAGGPAARKLADGGMEHAAELALASLASELGVAPAELRRAVEAIHWHDWTHDPLAGGAYAYVLVGGAGVRSRLARPVEDTLYFAGEACAEQGRDGTVDGALASGRQAARFILASES